LTQSSLAALGWSAFFQSQLDLAELPLTPARLAEVHRSRLVALTASGETALTPPQGTFSDTLTVGDWVLTDGETLTRRLDRTSALMRQAAGTHVAAQAIVANVDTIFIVTSCNAEFNDRRLERYLALVVQAGCVPVIVLTKADLSDDPDSFRDIALKLRPGQIVETVDARDPASVGRLLAFCGPGQTVALLGSSGVGKTTLTNALTGGDDATAAIREADAHGRHTTTYRALRPMPSGGFIIDTPGMRTLRLADVAEGIDATFAEVSDLADQCKFRDCQHESEPGCAIQAAIARGEVDAGRLERWKKLKAEDRRHSETLAEYHARAKGFGKLTRKVQRDKQRLRGLEEGD
jgi:ribosome biogenesis GTPase